MSAIRSPDTTHTHGGNSSITGPSNMTQHKYKRSISGPSNLTKHAFGGSAGVIGPLALAKHAHGGIGTCGSSNLTKHACGGSESMIETSSGHKDTDVGPTTVKSKIVLVGDCTCGKTTLIKRYVTGKYECEYTPTGFDTYNATYNVTEGYTIQLSLWDTSGKEEYNRVRPISYSDADIILLCYSIGDHESLKNVVLKWYPEIRENCPNQPIILVGCQKDLRDREQLEKTKKKDSALVTYEQGMKTAKTIDAVMYTEVSSRTSRKSVRDVIEVAAMSTAGCKADRKTDTFRRRRSDFRRKRFSEIGEAKRALREEVSKSCVVM